MVRLCMMMYMLTGQSQPGNDATANVHLVPNLVEHRSLYFTPKDHPRMFRYVMQGASGTRVGRVRYWRMPYEGVPASEAFEKGQIRVKSPMYYLVPTQRPGKYTNTFGIGAGLTALPILGPAALAMELSKTLELMWWFAKLAAALSVAGAVAFRYSAALRHLSARGSALLALSYGLGSCAYWICSQALWQHCPSELFLAMGAFFLLGGRGKA